MGERKVLNKYYPPDFDPSLILRKKKVGEGKAQCKVRMMLPMSIRCNTCGNYIYKGTKFNSRKEDAAGEDYLGIQVFRFYFKCPRCSAELVMKTDPRNSDYVVEAGASRNYEPWKDKDAQVEAALRTREEEEEGNAMKALENRTLDSKREMDISDALDEMRQLNAAHAGVTHGAVLAALKRQEAEESALFSAQVEAAAAAVFRPQHQPAPQPSFVRRLEEKEEEEEAGAAKRQRVVAEEAAPAKSAAPAAPPRPHALLVVKKKETPAAAPMPAAALPASGALAGLGAYGSSDSE